MELTKEQKLNELNNYLNQLARQKFNEECQVVINLAESTADKIAVLEKLKKEIEAMKEVVA